MPRVMGGRGRAEMAGPSAEEAEFVGLDEPMLRFTHRPAAAPIGSIMICSSVSAEFMKNYRREVRLARALAQGGFQATRLHYRGVGNSPGDPASVTLESVVADVHSASNSPTGYVGTRMGAMIAALAAPPSAPLVLWEPSLNGERWFKEAIRAAVISRAAHQRGQDDLHPTALVARLDSDKVLDVLGFGLHKDLVDGIRSLKLGQLLRVRSGPILIVQIGAGPVRPANLAMLEEVRAEGVDLTIVNGGRDVAWWFERGGARDFEPDTDIIEPTVAWLTQHARTQNPRNP